MGYGTAGEPRQRSSHPAPLGVALARRHLGDGSRRFDRHVRRRGRAKDIARLSSPTQWLDPSGATIMAYVVRRLASESIAMMWVSREGDEPAWFSDLGRVVVPPLGDTDALILLRRSSTASATS